jgi:hypothetical protein
MLSKKTPSPLEYSARQAWIAVWPQLTVGWGNHRMGVVGGWRRPPHQVATLVDSLATTVVMVPFDRLRVSPSAEG